jgi:aspartyl-tRNA synthetase
VFASVEGVYQAVWKECLGVELPTPFPRLTFREAMSRFGSDKPDLRYGLEFSIVTDVMAKSPINVVANGAKAEGGVGVALAIPGGAEISGTQLRKFEDVVKEAGAGGLSFFKVLDTERARIEKIFPGALADEFLKRAGAKTGDAVVFTSGAWEKTLKALGVLRSFLGQDELERSGLLNAPPEKQQWRFLWVREFPLFEWNPDRKSWDARHHMFTMPIPEHIAKLESDPGGVYAQLYDVVLNGNELGSGSIRIHRPDIQERVMKVVGFTQEQLSEKFGFLIDAYRYASPPHGGIGMGLDRIVMLLAGRDSIRDTMAFPKTASAVSLMDGSPAAIEPDALKELGIRIEG